MGRFVVILFCLLAMTTGVWAAPIHDAVAKGDLAKVKAMVAKQPALVNAKDKDGATPLHYAAEKGNIEMVIFLLSKKASVSACKTDGVTPLHIAAALGRKDAVEVLLKAKANPNAKDKKGRTPISLAQAGGFVEIEQILKGGGSSTTASTPPKPPVDSSALRRPEPDSSAGPKKEVATLAKEFVDLVTRGEYVAACGRMDINMKRLLPPDKIAITWRALTTELGPYKGMGDPRVEKVQGMDVVHIKCQFEKATYDAQISFDNTGMINGFYVLDPAKPKPAP